MIKIVPMSDSQREVEVKLAFSSAEEALARITALGAVEETPRIFEDNVVFERDDDSLRERGQTLRLRRTGDRSIVTLKSRVQGEFRHKVRQEDESEVADADAMERVFLGLGFHHGWRYQKYRTLFRLDELLICLDETALGCFVELEGPGPQIDVVARKLGYGPESYIVVSYRRLQEMAAGPLGQETGDLLMPRDGSP